MRKNEHQTICIVEFSYGKKAPDSKETKDDVKLARNATRILNKLLDSVSCKKARVYTIQCVNGHIHIRYMVRPLPSVYLYDEFACIKIPTIHVAETRQFRHNFRIRPSANHSETKLWSKVEN